MSTFRRMARMGGRIREGRAPARRERPRVERAERARARREAHAHGAMRFLACGPAGYPFVKR
ncbi:hypothetical protein [Miltoncostaea marina]|uniref:hypothetical protein n=1 Tax=Miltoncostaea marina TaxID=2843215 RepID=UPI001C3D28E4|nr:hypothetical protein [Miltoncostaea marina]